jgi:hypothetical protein
MAAGGRPVLVSPAEDEFQLFEHLDKGGMFRGDPVSHRDEVPPPSDIPPADQLERDDALPPEPWKWLSVAATMAKARPPKASPQGAVEPVSVAHGFGSAGGSFHGRVPAGRGGESGARYAVQCFIY